MVGKAKNTGDVFTWTKGDADLSHAEPANNSQLAVARPKKDDEVLRVFYQKKTNDNTLGEVVYTKQRKRWQVGTTKFPQALSGSGLSAISAKPAGEVRLYYQGTDKKLKEHFLATNGVWAASKSSPNSHTHAPLPLRVPNIGSDALAADLPDYPLTPASKISVLLWGTNQDQPELQIRVYAADQNKNVVQITYDDGSWDDQIKVYGKTYSTNDVSAAALSASRRVDGPQEKIAIFYQAEGNAIVELSVDTQAIVPKGLPTSL